MEQRPRRARRLTDAEHIFNLHGFFYKTWRSIVGVFRSSEELDAHERDLTCPLEVLYSVDDQSTGDYENTEALRQQLLFDGEEKARVLVVVMSFERYIRSVRGLTQDLFLEYIKGLRCTGTLTPLACIAAAYI